MDVSAILFSATLVSLTLTALYGVLGPDTFALSSLGGDAAQASSPVQAEQQAAKLSYR